MNRKRALLYAALALAVPLPALALPGGTGAADLGVDASLAGCGLSGGSIVCRIDASFNRVPDAEYYTASVTAANGAVTDLGTVPGGGSGTASTGAWVPYVGNGTYTVTVSAWGYDERSRPEVVESDDSGAGRDPKPGQAGRAEAVTAPEAPPAQEPAPVEPEQPAAGEQPLPECPEVVEEAPEADLPDTDGTDSEEEAPVAPPAGADPAADPCAPPSEQAEQPAIP